MDANLIQNKNKEAYEMVKNNPNFRAEQIYDGKKVIENLSFSVAAGEVYGLLGANGVGKSTTIECIPWDKESGFGNGSHFGARPRGRSRKQLLSRLGYSSRKQIIQTRSR